MPSLKKQLSIILLGIATTAGCVGEAGDAGEAGESGAAGIACWDKDESGVCDPGSEDVDGDGTCSVSDCGGKAGTTGTACWDLDMDSACDVETEDKNASGTCDVTDCAANGAGYILNGTAWQNASFNIGGHGTISGSSTIGSIGMSDPSLTLNTGRELGGSRPSFRIRGDSSAQNSGPKDLAWFDNQGGLVAGGDLGLGGIPATGGGVRMMWYPYKAAFRVGSVFASEWDDDNTGFFSIGGGYQTIAKGAYAVALGEGTQATGNASVALGSKTIASGIGSFASGGGTLASGNYSVALGFKAAADTIGSFVFADSTNQVVSSSANNQFTVRASGGIRLFTNSALTAGVTLAPGGGSWQMVSDRNMKTAFKALDGEDLLARLAKVEVSSWVYKEEVAHPRHIGPMAQDFFAAFGLGTSDKSVNSLDLDGVNMAAIQALELRTRELAQTSAKVTELETEVKSLRADLERLEKLVLAQQQARVDVIR